MDVRSLVDCVARAGLRIDARALVSSDAGRSGGLLDALALALGEPTQKLPVTPTHGADVTQTSESKPRDGEIETRDDVVKQLERICAFYARHEPASPVPFLLKRAERLVKMDFISAVRELADKGLPQLEVLAGQALSG
jgi:predicted component of type VI protein secretion system